MPFKDLVTAKIIEPARVGPDEIPAILSMIDHPPGLSGPGLCLRLPAPGTVQAQEHLYFCQGRLGAGVTR